MSLRKLLDLTGKVALVTGGSRGLGLQIAEALGEMGAKLALTARKADELEEAQRARLQHERVEALPVVCDLAQTARRSIRWSSRCSKHYGQIDILVNNAGTTWGAPAEETSARGLAEAREPQSHRHCSWSRSRWASAR